jgi:hypothetical protein
MLQMSAAPRTEGCRHDVIIYPRPSAGTSSVSSCSSPARLSPNAQWSGHGPRRCVKRVQSLRMITTSLAAAGELPLLISLPGPVCCVLPLGIVPAAPLPCPLPCAPRRANAPSEPAGRHPPYLLFPARPPPTARQSSRTAATYIVALPNTAGPRLLVCSVHPS